LSVKDQTNNRTSANVKQQQIVYLTTIKTSSIIWFNNQLIRVCLIKTKRKKIKNSWIYKS